MRDSGNVYQAGTAATSSRWMDVNLHVCSVGYIAEATPPAHQLNEPCERIARPLCLPIFLHSSLFQDSNSQKYQDIKIRCLAVSLSSTLKARCCLILTCLRERDNETRQPGVRWVIQYMVMFLWTYPLGIVTYSSSL